MEGKDGRRKRGGKRRRTGGEEGAGIEGTEEWRKREGEEGKSEKTLRKRRERGRRE